MERHQPIYDTIVPWHVRVREWLRHKWTDLRCALLGHRWDWDSIEADIAEGYYDEATCQRCWRDFDIEVALRTKR